MSNHTPSPWVAQPFAGRWIVWPIKKRKNHTAVAYDLDEGDARLMAAAPDLLEALKLAQSIIGHPDDEGSKIIAAAIAKAMG